MAKTVVNSDIYNISELVDNVKQEFLPDETESTLAVSTYGYIGAIESKRLQTQVQMTSELSNESFPSRARLERNVITHAIMYNIDDINAIPSTIDAIIAIRQDDIESMIKDDDTFVLDRECPIYLGDYEFHLEYDIIIKRTILVGNEKVYTAQYDITRENPISNVINPYLKSPAVVAMDSGYYVFLNVILRQMHHQTEYKKLVTSNVIDNKTINFEFEDQLAYFEVKISESDDEKYLTPLFEGSGVPDGTAYYCWYQYIDTNMIRVRFDRNSYMPGLNAEIEILVKTCKGSDGNFEYADSLFVNFESSNYGYKNLTILFIPQSSAKNGKDRKSKKELQALIPKEGLARGSLTTIKDLNNYFGMLDSENGRIVIQKKIDNQIERTYYAYLLLKDVYGNIVPTNTIDIRIPMDQFIKTQLASSQSPRYILRSGSCFKLGSNGIGEFSNIPIKNTGISYELGEMQPGKDVTVKFSAKITDASYDAINCIAYLTKDGSECASKYIEFPVSDHGIYAQEDTRDPEVMWVNELASIGQAVRFNISYTSKGLNTDIVFSETLDDGLTYISNSAKFFIGTDLTNGIECETSIEGQNVVFTIPAEYNTEATSFTILFDAKVNVNANIEIVELMHITEGSNESNSSKMTLRTLQLSSDKNISELNEGDIIEYTAIFKSFKTSNPSIRFELSRGLSYVTGSSKIDTGVGNPMSFEPSIEDLTNKAGFLYTNPYSIVINQYHLYSTFYMMCVNESPYLHFKYTNQKSAMQFISTNLYWNRPFLGYNNDSYTMRMEITQSIAKDFGLIQRDEHGEITGANVQLIAVFLRSNNGENPVPYRYKKLDLIDIDADLFSYTFEATMQAADEIDNDNNIKINNVGLLGQTVEEYGYFNANTQVRVYALCSLPNSDGSYSRYDLDKYVPGLDGWTVTNMYEVENGVNFYQNYADIMGSRVEPYGTTKIVDGKSVLIPDGYLVKGVPVFGYDYSQDESLINNAIDALNYRKTYIDETIMIQENSFGIDFKLFNTYGPSHTFYIIKDINENNLLDDTKEFIDRVDIAMYFRMKLVNSSDTYTKDLVIKDIKDYIEDLNELNAVHIPNLVTQITNTYKESITYFEFLGFDSYKANVQHIYKLPDNQIGIHVPPEHICIRNYKGIDGELHPDITIYISES